MNADSYVYVASETAFQVYKNMLDHDRDYDHLHKGTPDHYPCLVDSIWWDDPNGPYTYHHSFTYRKDLEELLILFYSPEEQAAHEAAEEAL